MIESSMERTSQLRKARRILTIFAVPMLMVLARICFVLFPVEAIDKTSIVLPTPTPEPTPTSLPELVTVEYQIEVVSKITSTQVDFWYTSEAEGTNKIESTTIGNVKPFTITKTVTIDPGEHVEIAGVIANGGFGTLTCRILVDDVLIEQSTSQGPGTSVNCSGFAFSQKGFE